MVEEKKGREKSPMYPSISLKEAVVKVKILYDEAGRNSVDKKLAAQAMGYKSDSLSGSALTLLSSLYQYGLVVRKKGEMGISDDAFAILNAPEGSREKNNALSKCGSTPKIFGEIHAKYSDKLPADNILIWYLQQQKYSKQAAETIIKCYKETVEYAKLSEKWPIADIEKNADVLKDTNLQTDISQIALSQPQEPVSPQSKLFAWTFPFGEKAASLTITGGKPNQTEVDSLKDSLISILDAFKKTLPKEESKE